MKKGLRVRKKEKKIEEREIKSQEKYVNEIAAKDIRFKKQQ